LGIDAAVGLPGWIGSLGQTGVRSVLTPEREPWTLSDVSGISAILSNAACIVMMVTVYRRGRDESDSFSPLSRFLMVMTKAAVIAWGIWVTFNLVRLVLTPYTYAMLRNYALQIGRTPPPFLYILADATHTLLSQVGLFAGPYIIWRASSQPKSGFPSIEPPTSTPT
jgi:hypothetical protein